MTWSLLYGLQAVAAQYAKARDEVTFASGHTRPPNIGEFTDGATKNRQTGACRPGNL
jgi:hypothetical protein